MTSPQRQELMRLLRDKQTTYDLMSYLQHEMSPTLISDLCVWPDDVPESDAQRAIEFFKPQTELAL